MSNTPSPAVELLPCDFCGGRDAFVERANVSSCYVTCNDCGARGPICCDETDADIDDDRDPGELAAIRHWNTRTSLPTRDAAIEEAAKVADWGATCALNSRFWRDHTPESACKLIAEQIRALKSPTTGEASAPPPLSEPFQVRVGVWMEACFTPEIIADKVERADRFIEESLELVQATGYSAERAHALVDYVFGRPIGEPSQEVGGVMVTLAALCNPHGLDMDAAAETELARIWTKIDKIRAKQAAKPVGSALPQASPTPAESGAGAREDVERVARDDALNAVRDVISGSASLPPEIRSTVQSHLGAAIRNIYEIPALASSPTEQMREALDEARLQLEYLDERHPTGTTPAVLARINEALGGNHD